MKKLLFSILAVQFFFLNIKAQNAPFDISLEPVNISNVGGLQSFAYAQNSGKWLVIGGRLDGLHRRQPFAAFDIAGNNNQIIVIDPIAEQKWSVPLNSLSSSIKKQMSSTNMEFHQDGDYLYIIGGYGYNYASSSKKTFPNMTAVFVPGLINAVISGTPITSYFRQISDPLFAVTGGHLEKINDTYYLVGGHKFDGDYNPMGMPTFAQEYTNAIRKFTIVDNGINLSINHLPSFTDPVNLHRRDYNAVPQILPDGSEGITAFSGVFQSNVDLPYLNCVNIDSTTYSVNNNFQQFYNHYHCPVLPIYSSTNNEMNNVFFGGIAQYYESQGSLIQDNNVPFVNTIARVTRNSSGVMAEYKLPIEMPSLLGASAEFIPNLNQAHYENNVFKLDELMDDTTLIGYIYGGINSTAPNIFFINDGTQSTASSQIFKVYLIKNSTTGFHKLNERSIGYLKLKMYPNPAKNELILDIQHELSSKVYIQNLSGQILREMEWNGADKMSVDVSEFQAGIYIVRIESENINIYKKLIIQ